MIPEEDPGQVERRLKAVIRGAAKGLPGIHVGVRRLLLARALAPLPGHERLAESLRTRASAVLRTPIPITASPLYTDARLYAERGVPIVLYGAGPRTMLEANAKRADENLLMEDLKCATIVVAWALSDLLSA